MFSPIYKIRFCEKNGKTVPDGNKPTFMDSIMSALNKTKECHNSHVHFYITVSVVLNNKCHNLYNLRWMIYSVVQNILTPLNVWVFMISELFVLCFGLVLVQFLVFGSIVQLFNSLGLRRANAG